MLKFAESNIGPITFILVLISFFLLFISCSDGTREQNEIACNVYHMTAKTLYTNALDETSESGKVDKLITTYQYIETEKPDNCSYPIFTSAIAKTLKGK